MVKQFDDPYGFSHLKHPVPLADNGPLCCCEYVNLSGERSHLLAVCCNCKELDDAFERCVTCRPQPSRSANALMAQVVDRVCRLPFPGGRGALALPPAAVAAFLLQGAAIFVAALSPLTALFVLAGGLAFLGLLYKKRLDLAAAWFPWWTLATLVWSLYVFEALVLSYREILIEENLLFLMLASLAAFHLRRFRQRAAEHARATGSQAESSCLGANSTSPNATETCLGNESRDLTHCSHCGVSVAHYSSHSLWLGACVSAANERHLAAALAAGVAAQVYAAHLTLCTLCTPAMVSLGASYYLLLPTQCNFVFVTYVGAGCFVTAVNTILVVLYEVFVLLRLVADVSLGGNSLRDRNGFSCWTLYRRWVNVFKGRPASASPVFA